MSGKQLTKQVMSLPLNERVRLAEALWQSIDDSLGATVPEEEKAAIKEAMRRDAELSSGAAAGRSHQEVMKSAKQALK